MIKDALRIADLEKQLAERTSELIQQREELAVVSSVQEALVQELDMQAIYDLVGDKIRDLFDANAIIISTFDHEAGMEVFNYAMEEGERHYVDNRPLNKLRHHLIQSRQKIVINTQQEAVEWFGDEVVPGTKYMQSGVFVPLIAAGKVTGYVSLQNVEHEYAFSEMEIRLLETLCHSMSTALQSARLLKETEQRTAELAVINSVQEGLAKELDMQAIYDLVGNRIRELFDAQVVGIATIDHLNEVEHIHFLIEKNERYYPVPRPLNTLRKHLIQTKERVLINKNFEAVASAFGMKHVPGTEPPRSALYVPLIIGDKATGYVSLQNIDRENAFSEGDVRLLETLANTMAVSLENARLFDETTRLLKETEQQKAELGVINSVQEGLAKELDIQAIYDLVGDRITKLFKAQAVVIATFDHDTSTEHFKYLMEDDQRFYLASRPYDKLRQHLIINKKKIVINTDYAEAYAKFGLRTLPGTNMTKSGVFVPLIIGDKVNSYISLQNNETENAFSEGDVRLLETLANSMSVALENARLFDETTRLLKETEQRTTELAVINSVQEGLAHELEINAIYDLVGNKIREVFNAQGVIIATFDHERGMEVFNFLFEDGERYYSEPRRYDKLRYELIMKKQSILINSDVEKAFADFGLKVVPGTAYPQSLLFVPMIVGNRVTSYVSLQNTEKEYAFNESDVRLLETLANSMSVALENARLFDETNRLLKETEDRAAELALINGIQEGLASKLEFQSIINLVGDKLTEIFNAQCTVISLYLSETREVEHRYAIERGERLDLFLQERAHPIDKFRQEVVETRKPYLINENYAHIAAKLDEATILEGDEPKSLLFMPMIVGSEVKGIISLQNLDIENAFSESDVRLLQTVVNAMSVALENARLFDETQRLLKETEQRNTELAVINSVQEGLVEQMEMQSIYDLVGNQIREIFDAQVVVIWSFDHQAGLEHSNFNLEKGVRYYPKPRHIDQLRRHLIKTKEPIMIKEDLVNTLAKYGMDGAKPIPGTEMPKSGLWVPLVVGETVKGYISLQNVDREHAFTDSDVRLLTTLANSMSVALENARLFDETNRLLKETEQRTAELAVINSVQDGLAKELDMQGIYDLVGDRVQNLFHTHAAVIASFDLTNKTEHFNYVFENGEKYKLDARPIGGLRQLLIDKKHTIYIDTEEKAKNEFGIIAIGETKMPKSLIFVPLLSGNQIKGYVSIQNIEKEHAFSDSDIRLLETLSNSMSVALENARLFDETHRLLKETEQRTAELSVINSVQDGLARELDIQGIYHLVGDKLCELFPDTQTLVIRTFDHQTGLEHFQYAIEKGKKLTVEPQKFMWASRILLETKKPIDIRDNYLATALSHGGKGVTTGKPPKSAVFVPMLSSGSVFGSISLQNVDREHAFSDSDIRLLTTLTNSMTVALENARLFDETNRLLKETEQRTAELAVINSVQDGLVREMDIQAIYDLVGERICALFDTQTVILRTFDLEKGLEQWKYVIEKGERLHSEPRPIIWANKEIIRTGQPLLINKNYVKTAKKFGSSGFSKGSPPKSAMFVPLKVGDEVKGSVSLQNVDRENAFSDADLRLLTTLTNSMSVALENARLFNETTVLLNESKQRAAELATVNNISKAMASLLDPKDLIQMVGDQIRDLFKANIVYLALYDANTRIIHFPYQYGEKVESREIGEGLTSKILMTGEPLLINHDVAAQSQQMGVQILGITAASYLGVPIPVGDEMIGVMSVQTTEEVNRFNENDLRLLTTIASSVGVALRNATLFEDVKKAKQQAEEATKLAEEASAAKGAFLSTVSHELRTPLTSVLGFAKIIRKRLEERIFPLVDTSDKKTERVISQIAENLQVVISEGERLTNLINDVLDLAKIEAGKMEWHQEPVSLPDIAERAIAATSALFDQKSLKLVKNIDTNLPELIGDKDKLIQVVINLISNAVKFTDAGSVSCRVYRQENDLILSVTDTGIGIASQDYDAVFEQFKQVVGDTLTDKPKGTGLGLPICKQIIEHHGGRIWLESELGKGSTFYIALPIVQAEPSSKPIYFNDLLVQLKEQVAHSKLQWIGDAANILIVDDDESIRSLLRQELGDAGYQIEEASNGKEALDKIRVKKPDLIILDIMMPEMNGFDVAAVLKNDPNTMDIPIIVLSVIQDKARGFRIGVDRYLTKPIDTGLLFGEIGSLLEQGKSKKKVMIVDQDEDAVKTLTEVLAAKGYEVTESKEGVLVEDAVNHKPDIIILNATLSDKNNIVQSLRFENGLENVVFLLYQ